MSRRSPTASASGRATVQTGPTWCVPSSGWGAGPAAPFVIGLKNDRWFVVTSRRTSSDNTVILQTEITAVVRNNRLEKNRLIDAQENFLQAAFDHMPQGVATFSAEGTLLINNAQFGALLTLPIQLTTVGTSFGQIIEFLKAQAFVGDLPHDDFTKLIRYVRRAGNLRQRVRHVSDRIWTSTSTRCPMAGASST